MKRLISLLPLLLTACALGCQEKPEIAFEEYGETSATLPFVENLPDDFPLPEEADPPTCLMREQAINGAKFDRELTKEAAVQKADATDSQAK